jgi:hypothetical protein
MALQPIQVAINQRAGDVNGHFHPKEGKNEIKFRSLGHQEV